MSRKPEPVNPQPLPATDEQVIAYIRAHPDFFARHAELLPSLVPPSRFDGDPVVDMQQFMISRLNHELEQMRGCAEHLISTSRNNMSTQSRTHQAILALLDAGDPGGIARVVAEDLPTLLDVDVVAIGFEAPGGAVDPILPGALVLAAGTVDQLLGSGEVLLRGEETGDPAVFGDGAGLVASYALVRLADGDGLQGLLALGSRHQRAFHSNQGTELLGFLARVIEHCLRQCRPAPNPGS